ncbi:MAG: rod shape-determining protein MreC [Rhodospirillales bacterium]
MALKPRTAPSVVRLTAPLRAWAQRFSIFLFIVASVMLMVAGRVDTPAADTIRGRVIDAFAPILEAFAAPAATAARVVDAVIEARDLYGENQRLREQNALLLQWQQAALRLEAENRSLRTLLNVRPDPAVSFVTARVVAEPGGAFVRTVLVMAGRRNGVRRGQAAMSGVGVVGRVVEVGEWSSRVLLVTDLNARIPVQLEEGRVRAVLAGDNTDRPRLMHLASDAHVAVGDRVVTSGVGGMFPAGLPIGVVGSVTERMIRVQPLTDLRRLEHVKILDFGLPTNLLGTSP